MTSINIRKLSLSNLVLWTGGILLIASLARCASAPPNENRTFAEKLNGENYPDKRAVMGIPVGTRAPQERKISGSVFCGEGIAQAPVNNAQITLKSGSKELSTVSTNIAGLYELRVPVDPKVSYVLRAQSSCGKKSVTLSGAAVDEIHNLNFNLGN